MVLYVQDVVTPQATPLHVAVQRNALDVVNQLLHHPQINPNVADQWGFAPLHYAEALRNKEMIGLLLSKGASVNSKSEVSCSLIRGMKASFFYVSIREARALDLAQHLQFDELIEYWTQWQLLRKETAVMRMRMRMKTTVLRRTATPSAAVAAVMITLRETAIHRKTAVMMTKKTVR